MTPSTSSDRFILRAVLLCVVSLAAGLLLPGHSIAAPGTVGSEERAARAEERVRERTARAEERADRAREREELRVRHAEEREARRNAKKASGAGSGEAGATTTEAPDARPFGGTSRHCRPTIQASATRIMAGETVTLTGTLGCPAGTDAATRLVTIDERQAGVAHAAAVAQAITAEPDGSFTLTSSALDANTVFQVREGRRGARAIVKVAPKVTLAIVPAGASASSDTKAAKHTRVMFTGTVDPVGSGGVVALQIAYAGEGEHWRTVAFGHASSEGGYSIAHTFRVPGEVSIRTVAHVGRANVIGISETLSYATSQPQNPQLTIQTSADPITAGGSVTISGIAAGAANEPVELLARTAGGAFAVVAEAMTDAEGNYTFTQTPLQDTFYRVSNAITRSTILLEGVTLALTTEALPTSAAQAGQTFTFTGTVAHATAGQAVYLERGSVNGVGYHVVGVGNVNAASEYQIAYTFDRAGTALMRVKVPGDSQHEASVSAPFTVTVAG